MTNPHIFVIPAHAGIQCGKRSGQRLWIPVFAGMTKLGDGPFSPSVENEGNQ